MTDLSGLHGWLPGSAPEVGKTGGKGLEEEDTKLSFRPAGLEVPMDIRVLSKKKNPFLDFSTISFRSLLYVCIKGN